jgi:hypothetical protein
MKKTMSMVQVDANRANSHKSTGPKTAEGKANSRRNALKRGILAREVVLREETGGERAREFHLLHRGFWQHLEPEGPVEEALVERMVTAYWRLHRVLIAERGEIARRQSEAECRVGGLGTLMMLQGGMRGSAADVAKEMEVLHLVRRNVDKDGELTAAALEHVTHVFGTERNPITIALQKVWEDLLRNPEWLAAAAEESAELTPETGAARAEGSLQADALRAGRRERMLTFIDRELMRREWGLTEMRKREAREAQARRDASFLPSPGALDNIWRYETMLERQFYRAMNQLERLQRARRGEVVPPPLTMEISGG